jgi:hypothetical protein
MSFIELMDRVKHAFIPHAPESRSTRQSLRMDELSNEWASELTRADYSHLPSREDTPPMR